MDVARAPLDRRVDGGVHEADDRARVARDAIDRQAVLGRGDILVAEDLHLEALGRLVEHPLGAFAFLENRPDRRRGAHADADRRGQQRAELVDHRQVGRIRHDDHERPAVAPVGHEAVAQHQVGWNLPEQLVVDVEPPHVHEFEPVPLGHAPGLSNLGRPRRRGRSSVV